MKTKGLNLIDPNLRGVAMRMRRMVEPGRAFADGIGKHLGVSGDVALAIHVSFVDVVGALFGARHLDQKVVDDFCCEAVNVARRKLAQKVTEPPISRLPGPKAAAWYFPASVATHQMVCLIHDLAQINFAPPFKILLWWKQRHNHRSSLPHHVHGVAPKRHSDHGRVTAGLRVPHEQRGVRRTFATNAI